MKWHRIVLEVSLKAFPDPGEKAMSEVIAGIFRQWDDLIRESAETALMFWAADGSEILTFAGDPEAKFEWGKWVGVANPPVQEKPLPEARRFAYLFPREYRENPRTFSYRELHGIVLLCKRIFREKYGKDLLAEATFDPGMEFAVSAFKYRDHHECCLGHGGRFVCCYQNLHADRRRYAGFPDGIPEGTSFGTFFGRQTQAFLRFMDMDGIWFSNGFGFGMEAWGACGAVFTGTEFLKGRSKPIHDAILGFWHDFRRECPDFPIETRGTNYSTGIDVSTDATPLRDIYRLIPGISGPPNSPSGSLDGNYAMCIVNYLSHIAELPMSDSFTFRFYLHDPWFKASAWRDYYERSPHDILLPLSLARIDGRGAIRHADVLHILSIDDSKGEMPDAPAREVTGGILGAMDNLPDAPGPLVWIYPFDEVHLLAEKDERLEEIYSGDYLIRGAINEGFPLNSVISSRNFLSVIRDHPDFFRGCILVFPTVFTVNPQVLSGVEEHLRKGGTAICYGPARGKAVEVFLGLAPAPPLEGEFRLSGTEKKIMHAALLSGGPLDRINADPEHNTVEAEYEQDAQTRPALLRRRLPSAPEGSLFWIRGTNSFTMKEHAYAPAALDARIFDFPERLFLRAMDLSGWKYESEFRTAEHPAPVMTWHRCRNGFYLAGFGRDTTSRIRLRLPDGAPLPCGHTVTLEDGMSCFSTVPALDLECRVFAVSGHAPGLVRCKAELPALPEVGRRILVMGLDHAELLYRPEPGTRDNVRFHNAEGELAPLARPDDFKVERGTDRFGDYCRIKDVSNILFIVIPESRKEKENHAD